MQQTVLHTEQLRKHYTMGGTVVRALDGVSLSVPRGEFLALLGTSGSGKSTLLNLIAGLDHPSDGSLRIFDQDLAAMSRKELSLHRRRNVGIIFQSFNLVPSMTALENVTLAMMFAGVPRAERDARAASLLESVGLKGRQHHRPKELSGGEQQRVAIARALSNNPQILLADEPTGNLDTQTSHEVMEVFARLRAERGITIVVITHERDLAAWGTRTIDFKDGVVVQDQQHQPTRGTHAPVGA